MDNICVTCPMNGMCQYKTDGWEYDEVCENRLIRTVESARDDYRAAWFEYIDEFNNC